MNVPFLVPSSVTYGNKKEYPSTFLPILRFAPLDRMAAAAASQDPTPPNTSSPSPSAPATPAATKKSIKTIFKDADEKLEFTRILRTLTIEMGHTAPYSLTSGILILSLLTLNLPLFVMGLSMIESLLLSIPISSIFSYLTPANSESGSHLKDSCSSHYTTMNPPMLNELLSSGLQAKFPTSLYSIAVAFFYCFNSMLEYSEEMTKLGVSYSNRPYLALLSGALFLSAFSIYLYASGCYTLLTITITVLLGLLIGYLLTIQNSALAGDKSILNVLFIPQLVKQPPAYVCATVTS